MFHDMGWGDMWFGWIFWMLIVAAILWAFIRITRNRQQSGSASDSSRAESPLDILKKRYARGEISKEEFEQIKKDIQN